MNDYKKVEQLSEENDFEYVHRHSGIPNHAFYLAAKNLQGNVLETVGPIWWNALSQSEENETFASFAAKTISIAKSHSQGEAYSNAIQKAWQDVGVKQPTHLSRAYQKFEEKWAVPSYVPAGVLLTAVLGAYYYTRK